MVLWILGGDVNVMFAGGGVVDSPSKVFVFSVSMKVWR
jgi:hypothetical protein